MTNLTYLPHSARRYTVSQVGKIFDKDGVEIVQKLIDGHYTVEIPWISGQRDYKVAILVLVSHGLTCIPDHLYDEIEPLYIDGDSSNLTAQNIIYKYVSGSLEVEEHPDFFYIPMYDRYAISKNGVLLNVQTGKYKTWSITKPVEERNSAGGYHYNRVVGNNGSSSCLFRHRAIALAFLNYDRSIVNKVINHLDGIPGNDHPSNLEICTYLENNIHAVKTGLRSDNTSVLSKNLKTGAVEKFSSFNECAKRYGHPQGNYIRGRLEGKKIFNDYLIFKLDDGSEWPEIDLKTAKVHIAMSNNIVLGRNVFTGQIVSFVGTVAGSSYTGVKPATILTHARNNLPIPVNGWNFRYAHHDEINWPKHSKRHLLVYEKHPVYPPDGVIVTNTKTNEESFYTSRAETANKFKLGMGSMNKHIQTGILLNGVYRFESFDLRKNLSLPTEKSVEK